MTPRWILLDIRTTDGNAILACSSCGHTAPSPDKNHMCQGHSAKMPTADHVLQPDRRAQIMGVLSDKIGSILEDSMKLAYHVGVGDGMQLARETDK